jgi:magnesium-transporting ATPase (P-type)
LCCSSHDFHLLFSLLSQEACLTADFTILNPSISGVEATIRAGLVAAARTLHAHQALVLECLMSCRNLVLLYGDNVRYGKWMWPLESFVFSATQQLSKTACHTSRPRLPDLSVRPLTSFFELGSIVTVIVQAIINIAIMAASVSKAKTAEALSQNRRTGFQIRPRASGAGETAEEGSVPSLILNVILKAQQNGNAATENNMTPQGGVLGRPPFRPNLVTNVVFILSIFQSLLVSVIQHRGFPFYQDFMETPDLCRLVCKVVAVVAMLVCETLPWANELLGLAPWPQSLKRWLLSALVLNSVGCYLVDALCQKVWQKGVPEERTRQQQIAQNAPLSGEASAMELEELALAENTQTCLIATFRSVIVMLGVVMYSLWLDSVGNDEASAQTRSNMPGFMLLFALLRM